MIGGLTNRRSQTKTINGVKIKDDETRAAKRAYYASHTQIYLEANRRYLGKKKLKEFDASSYTQNDKA